tara:strand:- start:23306 stop:25387 length:2082 start_codon:yes stop_codon:yes gene_type:complete
MAENVKNKVTPGASNKYSLYAGREETVNWGQVAVNLTKGLNTIAKEREAAKQKIIDDTNAAMTELSEIADVQSGSMNSILIDGSDFSKNTLQANMDLVRRGLLDPKDYMLIMQQQKDGYKSLSNYAKNYDAKYQEGMARIQDGSASNLEEYFRGTGFSFGNVKNKKLWTDPGTGELFLVEMQPDPDNPGKFILPDRNEMPGAYASPSSMVNMIGFQEDSKNLSEDVKNMVTANLAEVVTATISSYSVLSGGKDVTSIEDFRQLFDDVEGAGFTDAQGNKMSYDDWMTQQAKGVVGNANGAAEYLMNANMGYFFTDDKKVAESNPLAILAVSDGGPPQVTISDKQMEAAENLAKNQINSQLDSVVKVNAGLGGQQERAQTTGEINQENIDDNINGYLNDLNRVLTDTDLQSAESQLQKLIQQRNEQNIKSKNPVINNVDITDDVILIEFDGREPIQIQRRKYNDDGTVAGETTLQEDIASLYDVLSPFGDKEGYDLSTTEVDKRIEGNVSLGDRGENRNVGFEEARADASTDNTSAKIYDIDGTDETILDYLRDEGGMSETTTGNRNAEIQRVLTQTINRFLSASDKQAFADAGFTGLKIDVSGTGTNNKITLIYKKPGGGGTVEEVREVIGTGRDGTTMEQLADAIADGMNKVNEDANKNRVKKGQTFRPTLMQYLKDNPEKTAKDYKQQYGL